MLHRQLTHSKSCLTHVGTEGDADSDKAVRVVPKLVTLAGDEWIDESTKARIVGLARTAVTQDRRKVIKEVSKQYLRPGSVQSTNRLREIAAYIDSILGETSLPALIEQQ